MTESGAGPGGAPAGRSEVSAVRFSALALSAQSAKFLNGKQGA